jgi:hypothetical protein
MGSLSEDRGRDITSRIDLEFSICSKTHRNDSGNRNDASVTVDNNSQRYAALAIFLSKIHAIVFGRGASSVAACPGDMATSNILQLLCTFECSNERSVENSHLNVCEALTILASPLRSKADRFRNFVSFRPFIRDMASGALGGPSARRTASPRATSAAGPGRMP